MFADYSPLSQSRLYCTRWDGKEKTDGGLTRICNETKALEGYKDM